MFLRVACGVSFLKLTREVSQNLVKRITLGFKKPRNVSFKKLTPLTYIATFAKPFAPLRFKKLTVPPSTSGTAL